MRFHSKVSAGDASNSKQNNSFSPEELLEGIYHSITHYVSLLINTYGRKLLFYPTPIFFFFISFFFLLMEAEFT